MKGYRQSFQVGVRRSKSCVTLVRWRSVVRKMLAVVMVETYLLVKIDHAPTRVSPQSELPGNGR